MELFGSDYEDKLCLYKKNEILFSPLENSTCTVQGQLTNVSHDESELSGVLVCEYPIIRIDSNFDHVVLEGYTEAPKIRKSNRGRKKKPRIAKARKHQGDGSSFNSQISFTVIGKVIRSKPYVPDKHSLKAEKIIIKGKEFEKFEKQYKIKIFRNGRFTVPGVLKEDLSDIMDPIKELCKYFSDLFIEDVKLGNIFSVMRNYKFHLLSYKADIKKLYDYCVRHFQKLLNTKFFDIEEFILNPIFENYEFSPNSFGWKNFINEYEYNDNEMKISFVDMKSYLVESKNSKNLFVDFNKLKETINGLNLHKIYEKIKQFVLITQELLFVPFDDNMIKSIIKNYLILELREMEIHLKKSKDNMLSHIKYDPEKYPGFLIKIKTPNENDPNKKTTIKIFPSGKINVDGANDRKEAEYIYYWLNNLFYNNPEFSYNIENKDQYDEPDSEFSSDSENE